MEEGSDGGVEVGGGDVRDMGVGEGLGRVGGEQTVHGWNVQIAWGCIRRRDGWRGVWTGMGDDWGRLGGGGGSVAFRKG